MGEASIDRCRCGRPGWPRSTPVPAAQARQLGFGILTATMAQGAAIGVDSYDRLFPSTCMTSSAPTDMS
ncbi:MAG: TOTE conflict system archaeo-eukaryotic primase domain-containing protein [Solirubrobacteraceae bacterium]